MPTRRPKLPSDETLTADGSRAPVTYAEAGRMLGVSKDTIERIVARGELRSIIIGERRKIRRAELDRYIEFQQARTDRLTAS
jgi:excisionase family DNA binding protein